MTPEEARLFVAAGGYVPSIEWHQLGPFERQTLADAQAEHRRALRKERDRDVKPAKQAATAVASLTAQVADLTGEVVELREQVAKLGRAAGWSVALLAFLLALGVVVG